MLFPTLSAVDLLFRTEANHSANQFCPLCSTHGIVVTIAVSQSVNAISEVPTLFQPLTDILNTD